MRTLIMMLAGVGVIGLLGAGPLQQASAGLDVPVDDVAGREVARLLLLETLEEGEQRWRPDRLRAFVEELGADEADGLRISVVEDRTEPALAVTVHAVGSGPRQACVVADEDGLPESLPRPCR